MTREEATQTVSVFEKLGGLLRYVDGDYQDPTTFQAIRRELGSAQRPARLPRDPARAVRAGSGTAWKAVLCERRSRDRREAVWDRPALRAEPKPDLAWHLSGIIYLSHRSLPRQAPGLQHALLSVREFLF